jgi:PKD repeat protein
METNVSRGHMKVRLLATAVAVVGLTGCNLSKQTAPDLTGPSTLGRSVILTASPDRILYDGTSQATITATVRKADGSTDSNVSLKWVATVTQIQNGTESTTTIPVEPSPQVSTTGANGTATTVVRAPVAPDVMPGGTMHLTVYAMPIGDDAAQLAPDVDAKSRSVTVELVPILGPNAPDRLPVVDFLMTPPVANINETITFDGSLTRDEGVVCGDNCTYVWDFGSDTKTKTGRVVTQSFPGAGTRSIRLFVTDSRGFSASKTQTLTVNAPAAPVANFFVVPSSPRVGNAASFDASTTTVGIGAAIVSYTWDFGELGATATGKTASYSYNVAGGKTVTLTVVDDLGRISQKQLSVTVVP